MNQVAIAFAQTRNKHAYGVQASLTPMRGKGGLITTMRGGQKYKVEQLFTDKDKAEILYIVTFYLPRFLNQTFREKMITVLHELHHIGPQFDGDIRRLPGRCHVHSCSKKEYDRLMGKFVDTYLSDNPPEDLYAFLKYRFKSLAKKHGGVVGLAIPKPKLLSAGNGRD